MQEPRWRHRIVRAAQLMSAAPRFHAIKPICQLAIDGALPHDRDRAIGIAIDRCLAEGLCLGGTIEHLARLCELEPDEVLVIAADECRPATAIFLASSRVLPAAAVRSLARSPSAEARGRLAINRAVVGVVIDQLVLDPDPSVRSRAIASRRSLCVVGTDPIGLDD